VETNKRIASEEHWKNCPIDRCPNLGLIRDAVWRLEAQTIEFIKDMNTYKKGITERVFSIDQSMKGFASEFISTHKTILDGLLKRGDLQGNRNQGIGDNESE
jgi:hypothetical protein